MFDFRGRIAGQFVVMRGSSRLVTALAFLVGCAGGLPHRTAFLQDLATLEARVAQGRFEEALARAADLEGRAPEDTDRCPVLLARARAIAGLGRLDESLQAFRRVNRACASSPMVSARALFEVGVLVATRSPDPTDALAVFWRVVTGFPDEPAARRAVAWIRDLVARSQGNRAVVEELRDLYRRVSSSDVAPYLLFQAAQVLQGSPDRGSATERLALYTLIRTRHPDSHLADDASVEAARLCIAMGQPWVAARLAMDVLKRREVSWFIGSYETPIYPEATLLLAEAFLAAGDPVRAASALVRFAREFPSDRRVAEALWRAYHLFAASGRSDEAVDALRLLVAVRPRTPAGREARRRLETGAPETGN